MAQAGYTPIRLYYSTTASAVPSAANLLPGELGLNITDGKLYYEDNLGAVQVLADKNGATGTVSSVALSGGTTGLTASGSPITTSGTITLGGTLAIANGGTGTSTPNLVAGSNITITGTWPNQTISAAAPGTGTVTSVALSGGTTGITVSGSPITSSGTMTLGGTLAVANGGTGVTTSTGSGANVLNANPTFTGYTETVYTLGTSGSLALDPANGTIQSSSLTGDPTFTDSLSSGQSVALLLINGASYTVTWPTVTWVTSAGNTAPTLTANDTLVFWKISTTLYGAYVGSGA